MRNIAEFRIIGNVGSIETRDKVTFLSVAANYGRKVSGEWEDDTHWNRITLFDKQKAKADELSKGDLVHIQGRVRQTSFDDNGETRYGVDMIAQKMAKLSSQGEGG